MALPDLLEIIPLSAPVQARISVPGSKSITNRALILAALADGETVLEGALWSEDTQVMVDCLRDLGYMVNVAPDPHEPCNRTICVYGRGGSVPPGGSPSQPLELFVGNAGTAARFLTALVCLGQGAYRLHGVPRMHERPQAELFAALRQLGYRIDTPNDRLPAMVYGAGPQPGRRCRVSIEQSSQFASALLLCAQAGGWQVEIVGTEADHAPYVAMTAAMLEAFRGARGRFRVEPDASSGSYIWAAAWLVEALAGRLTNGWPTNPLVQVAHWPQSGWQVDQAFPRFLPLPLAISRQRDLGDSILTAMVLAPLAESRSKGRSLDQPVRFTDLGRLRVQECERVAAMRTELSKCGARVEEHGDTLSIWVSDLHGAEIETYGDHRIAMAFSILGLKVPGIRLKNPACVKKTFPNFFQKLAAQPPAGLGVSLRAADGRVLEPAEWVAE